jgi:hypothetical protein
MSQSTLASLGRCLLIAGLWLTYDVDGFNVPAQLSQLPHTQPSIDRRKLERVVAEKVLFDNKMAIKPKLQERLDEFKTMISSENTPVGSLLALVNDDSHKDRMQRIMKELEVSTEMNLDALKSNYGEFMVYDAIAQLLDYSKTQLDPFIPSKVNKFRSQLPFIEDVAARSMDIFDLDFEEALQIVLKISALSACEDDEMVISQVVEDGSGLNADMPVKNKRGRFMRALNRFDKQFLLDDAERMAKVLMANKGKGNIDIIVGDIGKSLFTDIFLGHLLLHFDICETITFHCRSFPSNVYSATYVDVIGHIDQLAIPSISDVWAVRHLGQSIRAHLIADQRFIVSEDDYWSLPTPFWNMPENIQDTLRCSKAVFIKGEDNYRRLLGGRECPPDLDSEVLSYWPVPICAVRAVKSDVICGIPAETRKRADFEDFEWTRSGKWSMIQCGGTVQSG